jgi:hypothetical protein
MVSSKKVLGAAAVLSLLAMAAPVMAQTYTTNPTTGASVTGSTTGTSGATGTSATTGTTGTSVTSSSTPGAPNTGAGGDTTENLLLLGLSGLVVVAGGAYLARKGATTR